MSLVLVFLNHPYPQKKKKKLIYLSRSCYKPFDSHQTSIKAKKNHNCSVHFACPQSLVLSSLHYSSDTLRPLGLNYSALKSMPLEAKKNQNYSVHFACPQSLILSSLHFSSNTVRLSASTIRPLNQCILKPKKNQNYSVHFACPLSLTLWSLNYSNDTLRPLGLNYSALKPMPLDAKKK